MKKVLMFIIIIALLTLGGALFLRSTGSHVKPIETLEGLNAIYEGEILDASDFDRIDGQVYLSYDFIKSNIDETIHYDSAEQTVIIAYGNEVKRLPLNSSIGWLNEKEFSIRDPLIEKDGKILLPIEVFVYQYDVNLRYLDEQQLIIIDHTDVAYLEGVVLKDDVAIRRSEDSDSEVLSSLERGERVFVYEEYEKSYKVRAVDGIPGFVLKDTIKLDFKKDKYKKVLLPKDEDEHTSSSLINLTWDYTYGKLIDGSTARHLPGVNVIAPTWFSVTDAFGQLVDRGHIEYAKKYHDMDVAIWGTLDNSFDADLTHQFLGSSKARSYIISQVMDYVKYYDLQGINIDFENISAEDRDALTQFTREISACLRSEGKTISIDVTPASDSENWSRVYDRKSLAEIVDYVVVMAYDQHWGTSPVAGSVAQYRWVEGSINGLFRSIPTEKMILGVPLYTRLWTEENGAVTNVIAIGMEEAQKFIMDNGIEVVWDEDSRQYFGYLDKDGKTYKIWLETEESLAHKISLVAKYGLAGIGSWRKGFDQPHIWEAMKKSLF